MIELLVLLVLAVFAYRSTYKINEDYFDVPKKLGIRMGKLWDIAQQSMRENKFLRAEKALLTILKIDEKNAAAYNRLGILYAKQKDYKDAIDCFEIASSIEKSASSFHNLGLIYYETGDYTRASLAFEEAISLDDAMAARHIAYEKAQEKLGNSKKMISELEKATKLEPNKETYSLLLRAYEMNNMEEKASTIRRRLSRVSLGSKRPKRVSRPPRVVV